MSRICPHISHYPHLLYMLLSLWRKNNKIFPRSWISLSTVWVSLKIWSGNWRERGIFVQNKRSVLKVVLAVKFSHAALRDSAQDSLITRILQAGGANTNFSWNFLLLLLVEKHLLSLGKCRRVSCGSVWHLPLYEQTDDLTEVMLPFLTYRMSTRFFTLSSNTAYTRSCENYLYVSGFLSDFSHWLAKSIEPTKQNKSRH